MKSYLDITCDPTDWSDLDPLTKLQLELKASADPVFFWNEPRMGNFPLFPSKIEIFNEMWKYEEGKRVNSELIFASGMRGGKTAFAGLAGLTETFKLLMMKNPQENYSLAPNTEISNINVANSLEQAKDTVFAKVKEITGNSPYLCAQDPYLTATSMKFPKNITFKALGSNLKSNVGRTVKSFVADEIDTYEDPYEVYDKLSKSTENFAKFGENLRIALGSPDDEGGFLLSRLNLAREEKWKGTVTVWRPTWELNPNIPYDEEARRRNPVAYDKHFGAQPSAKRENLFNYDVVKRMKARSITNNNLFLGTPDWRNKWDFTPTLDISRLRPAPDAVDYVIAMDPSIKHDAFGLSLQYLSTSDVVKTVGTSVFTSPRGEELKTSDIKKFITPICTMLPVRAMIFDIYMHSELHEVAKNNGIRVEQHNLKMEDWLIARNDLDDGKAEIPYSDYLFKEIRELLILNGKKIDHPRSGSKDQIDSIAQGISFFRREQEEAKLKSNNVATTFIARF
jgi:hypothetical protein